MGSDCISSGSLLIFLFGKMDQCDTKIDLIKYM